MARAKPASKPKPTATAAAAAADTASSAQGSALRPSAAAWAPPARTTTPPLPEMETIVETKPVVPDPATDASATSAMLGPVKLVRRQTLTEEESEDFAIAEPQVPTEPEQVPSLAARIVVGAPVDGDDAAKEKLAATPALANPLSVGPKDFEMLCVIGQGAFGKVVQVRHTPSGEILAMKIVSNKYIVKHNSVSYLQAERDIMTKINHPFLINLRYAFQTAANIYLVMPFISGGELFHHLHKEGLLLEGAAKFYAAEMVLALEHLHGLGIIHRDLKPENVLVDGDGHIRLTDFGLAKEMVNDEDSATTMCGTHEYMPPEMIRGKAYNQAVDWWALGALIYEMVTGYPPFSHKNRKKLHQKILNEKLNLPKWLSSDTHSILKQLLERNLDKRLGSGKSSIFKVKGVQAIKNHAFFRDIDWHLLAQKKLTPPIVPNVLNNLDTAYFSEEFTKLPVGRPSHGERPAGDSRLFARFSFIADDTDEYSSGVPFVASGVSDHTLEVPAATSVIVGSCATD